MREMRRQDRKLDESDILYILRNGEYGVMATVSSDGMPYSIPLSYAYDEDDNSIYMHCTVEGGQKIDNIRSNPSVCFTIVINTEVLPEKFATKYWSVNAFGKVDIIEDTDQKKYGLRQILGKYSSEHMEKGLKYIDSAADKVYVLKLTISEITGKARKQ